MKITLISQFVENLTEPKHDWRMNLQQLHKIIHQMLVVIRSGCQGSQARENSFQQKQSTAPYTWATWLHVGHVPRGWGLKIKAICYDRRYCEPRDDVASAKNIQLFRPLTSSEDIWKSAMNCQFIREKIVLKGYSKGLFSYQLLILKSCSYLVCSINQIAGQNNKLVLAWNMLLEPTVVGFGWK